MSPPAFDTVFGWLLDLDPEDRYEGLGRAIAWAFDAMADDRRAAMLLAEDGDELLAADRTADGVRWEAVLMRLLDMHAGACFCAVRS